MNQRSVDATALPGPANLMSAYRALVHEFGKDVDKASDFVWNAYKALKTSKQAAKVEWYPPNTNFDHPTHGQEPFDPFEGAKPHTPRTMPSLQDAADTVAKGLVSVENLRSAYSTLLGDYHRLDEGGRESLLNRSMEGLRTAMLKATPFLSTPAGHGFGDFKAKFLKETRSFSEPEAVFQVFLEYVFRKAFSSEYEKMKQRIMSGAAKWASIDSRPAQVVRLYMGCL